LTAHYPKVTVLSPTPMVEQNATGIMLRSLFRDWPKDYLSQIYLPAVARFEPDLEFCRTTRMIDLWGRTHRFADALDLSSNVDDVSIIDRSKNPAPQRGHRLAHSLKRFRTIHNALRTSQEVWCANSWIGSTLRRQLKELQPDIVYVVVGNYCLTKITYLACSQLNVPVFFHVVDDYATSPYDNMISRYFLQATSERWFRRMVKYASGVAAICSGMADEFGIRYGKDWTWYTTLIDANAYDQSQRESDGVVRIVYAGNLRLGRWKALKQLTTSLESLEKQGIKTQFSIYAPSEELESYRAALETGSITALYKWVPLKELPRIFHGADILVHAESFDPAMKAITKYSLSTKISQYLMAGRCVLAFGPEELASIRLISTTGAGVTIHETNQERLTATLATFLTDDPKWRVCGQNGHRWARENVEQEHQQRILRTDLVRAILSHEARFKRTSHQIPQPHIFKSQHRKSTRVNVET